MKLRIKGNSIRLRLTQTEITNFGEHGLLEEKTEFSNGTVFGYTLQSRYDLEKIEAAFSENTITVFVPLSIAKEWTTTDKVGFENKMDLGNGKQLFILIEKDFVCLDNTYEDQSDNFPNPNEVC